MAFIFSPGAKEYTAGDGVELDGQAFDVKGLPFRSYTLHPNEDNTTVTQGTFTQTSTGPAGGYGFLTYGQFAGGADADGWTMPIWMEAGTYTIAWKGIRNATSGKVQLSLDAVDKGALQDHYAAAIDYYRWSVANIVVAATGAHTLGFRVNGKNALSGSYQMFICDIRMVKTA